MEQVRQQTKKMLTGEEVRRMTSIPKSTMYRWLGLNLFPRPVKVGVKSVRWFRHDIETWMHTRPRTQ